MHRDFYGTVVDIKLDKYSTEDDTVIKRPDTQFLNDPPDRLVWDDQWMFHGQRRKKE